MTRPSPPTAREQALTLRAWYSATTAGFLRASLDAVLGQLAANSGFAVSPNQRDAWLAEIEILQDQLAGLSGSVFLEFSIPRMGKRIDAFRRSSEMNREESHRSSTAQWLDEAASLFLNGEPETERLTLRELVNATVGLWRLAAATGKPAKSLHRMLSANGNPSTDNLAVIFDAVRRNLGVTIKAKTPRPLRPTSGQDASGQAFFLLMEAAPAKAGR